MKTLFVVIICTFLFGCDFSAYGNGPVGKAIRHEVREKKQKEIDLVEVVPFNWDELYLYGPYMPRSEICKDLKLKELECLIVVSSESTDDGDMFLVLRHKKKIVHTEMYRRFNGDFTPLDFKLPITPSEAKFVVKEEGKVVSGEPWLKLRPARSGRRMD